MATDFTIASSAATLTKLGAYRSEQAGHSKL